MTKTIMVAGAAGLLGKHIVKTLLAAGHQVLACDLSLDLLQQRLSDAGVDLSVPALNLIQLDLTNTDQVTAFFAQYQHIDGVVNCIYPRNKKYGTDFLAVTLDDFNDNVALNLGSSFFLLQSCAKYFLEHQRPLAVVNFASIYGVVAPEFDIYQDVAFTMPVEYAAIKSALIHLSKYVCKYVSNSDFRVNVISPGGILDQQPVEFTEKYRSKCLGTGMLPAQSIAGTVLFLLSDEARYINGQNIIVDDGFTI